MTAPPRVGVVDIGTNSMRLLITDGVTEFGRWVSVTGLGKGVDEAGVLNEEAISRTLAVFSEFAAHMSANEVDDRLAMATSASRDASNRDEFFDRAERVLGVRPRLITGSQEGLWAFQGAVTDFDDEEAIVTDIGGGSTEFVERDAVTSVDIGSVRLTDRFPDRPLVRTEQAREQVRMLFAEIRPASGHHIGVAGTWTSLAAISSGLAVYDPNSVHGSHLDRNQLEELTARLCAMTIAETESIPGLDPKRAPVIAAGAIVASVVVEVLGVDTTLVSVKDTLDGAAGERLHLLR